MAGKNKNGLPLELNPNLSTSLKKKVESNTEYGVKSNSASMGKGKIKQQTKKASAPNMNPASRNYIDPGMITEKRKAKTSDSAQRIEKAINSPEKNNAVGKSVSGTLTKEKMTKGSKPKQASTKQTIKKAFDAASAMKARRAKAMANRDPSKNPNNVNLRGIVKQKKKGKKG